MTPLRSTLAAIDAANAEDPSQLGTEPLAQAQGRAASRWLDQLVPSPAEELQLAVRAHHLRRWELKRRDFPEGRAGYLRWRRKNKTHQADSLASLMREDGWTNQAVERTQTLLGRANLGTDPETQTLEDAACLVFLETQFDEMATRIEHDHLVSIVAKTLKKMSDDAVTLASSISLSPTAEVVLADAVTLVTKEESDDN